jgi:uncharacterized protein
MERFLPGRHQIESFGNGGFRLGGVSHQGAIVITPSGVRACSVKSLSALSMGDLDPIISEKTSTDMLLIGAGRNMEPLPKPLQDYLRNNGLGYDIMSTNAAVRTYNVVEAEDRRVAAILIAVDKAYD